MVIEGTEWHLMMRSMFKNEMLLFTFGGAVFVLGVQPEDDE
jgi:hypothetical protein